MIDEKKLLKEIEEHEKKYTGESPRFKNEKLNKLVLSMTKWFKAVIMAQSKEDWIPVWKKMPEKEGAYLISGYYQEHKKVGTAKYDFENRKFKTAWSFKVEAWKELPEAYEGEDKCMK